MREIVLDTETTGLDPAAGHRIVEIGCVELSNHVATGLTWQRHLNPERDMPIEAERVHGLSAAFLADKPRFAEVVDDLLGFVGDARLVIHNASFDLAFLNMELGRIGRAPIALTRAIDTVGLARRKIPPGAPASLDALCRRFSIDLTVREKHGAEIDCGLLADVYIELLGGRQPGLEFAATTIEDIVGEITIPQGPPRPPRPHAPTPEELAAHQAMLALLETPLWLAAPPGAVPIAAAG